ncbi:predicted protein [Plenodomus lingam JN3]|uniref:Predicted protein n=1 Tax=Leptosphaeria maculans (strain JN3 / isolate v23.1.3 / race Av1-4-5-6-7-8) TaxID=985895 RepID=E4ZLP4_LEPMJ|nr:predicted protein [Plenodomus lingam JN3]CBX92724.1 predicted protein [Plenodomus lingam JN3]
MHRADDQKNPPKTFPQIRSYMMHCNFRTEIAMT